jgi:predicted metalloprotease
MRWRGRRQSRNVEDRRGTRLGRPAGGLRLGGGGILVLLLGAWLLGVNPFEILGLLAGDGGAAFEGPPRASAPASSAASDEQAEFVSVVLADTEDTWSALFSEAGGRYVPPTLVLFSGVVHRAPSGRRRALT